MFNLGFTYFSWQSYDKYLRKCQFGKKYLSYKKSKKKKRVCRHGTPSPNITLLLRYAYRGYSSKA